jgi:hypothetical protein
LLYSGCHTRSARKTDWFVNSSALKNPASLHEVVLDTTVQPKAIAHPTDSRLLKLAREQLVDAAQDAGITLRQNYARLPRRRACGLHPTMGQPHAQIAQEAEEVAQTQAGRRADDRPHEGRRTTG